MSNTGPASPLLLVIVMVTAIILYYFSNSPDNLNLEMVGRDLRTSTCLNMELIPGVFTFRSVQGENSKLKRKGFKIHTQKQTKLENLLLLSWLNIKYVEFKKYILHVKLTVFYTVSFTYM